MSKDPKQLKAELQRMLPGAVDDFAEACSRLAELDLAKKKLDRELTEAEGDKAQAEHQLLAVQRKLAKL